MANRTAELPNGEFARRAPHLQTSLSAAVYIDFGGLTRGCFARISESEISLEKQRTNWRWRQSSANSSPASYFPVSRGKYREILSFIDLEGDAPPP